jgi:phosphoribosylglycinamide formyltransferase-1
MKSIIIMASGQGSNARAIIRYFKGHSRVCVRAMVSDRDSEGLKMISEECAVPFIKIDHQSDESLMLAIRSHAPDLIVLAGYLRKIPPSLVSTYPGSIVNLHPSLLPAYGGKGMYGEWVHKAVLEDGVPRSGITIHLVDEEYDRGTILLQASCPVMKQDDVSALSKRVQSLEHRYYSTLIESLLI